MCYLALFLRASVGLSWPQLASVSLSWPQFAMSRPGPRSWLRMAAGLPFLPMVKPGFWSCISSMRCVLMCCFMLYRWINLLNRQNNMFREIYHTVNRLQSFLSSCHLVIWSSGHPVNQSSGHLVIQSSHHFNMLMNEQMNGHTTLGSRGLLCRQIENQEILIGL